MIDPLHSLAFSIQAKPGVYALLIGSGVSTGAGVPTGWGITLDLVSKLAAANGDTTGGDPAAWYLERFGKDPNYSELLDALGKTSIERQQLLRGYFESVDQESNSQEGQPTAAHHAIAGLVANKQIRVIITTNFDRLLEMALASRRITPTVLSSAEQIRGALPLIHTDCCILKLHGDYLDPRIRNTEEELSRYPEEYDFLLDRIFDEFGLIVCGWSGEWDNALRSAIYRTPSRRFTTFWAAYGDLTDTARAVIDHRDAVLIPIDNADKFFTDVQEQVRAIDHFSRPHPYSVEVSVARLKHYLSDARYRIKLWDLVNETVERVADELSSDYFSPHDRDISKESVNARIRKYDAVSSTLLAMACVAGHWAEQNHFELWERAIQHLDSRRSRGNGMVFWLDMQGYPATLLLYALGIGAIEGGRLTFLRHVLCTPVQDAHREECPAVQSLPPVQLISEGARRMRMLEGMETRNYPLNDWLHDALRPIATRVIGDPRRYTQTFDKLEVLIALAFSYHGSSFISDWVPGGAFQYRYENRDRVMKEIRESLATEREESPFVRSGIFGRSVDECRDKVDGLDRIFSGPRQ